MASTSCSLASRANIGCGVSEEGVPDLAVCLHAGLDRRLDRGLRGLLGLAVSLQRGQQACFGHDLALPQVKDPQLALGQQRGIPGRLQRALGHL